MRPRVVLSGSYHRDPARLRQLFRELEVNGCRILSPISLDFDPADEFVTASSEVDFTVREIERFHLRSIRDVEFMMLHAPGGHIGLSTAYEIGYATALGKPVFAIEKPTDAMLASQVQVVSSVFEIIDRLGLVTLG